MAVYQTIPVEGDYYIWFRYKSGSFTFSVAGGPLQSHASPVPANWTWTKLGPFKFPRGWHPVIVKPTSLSLLMDGILVTNSSTYVPPADTRLLPR